MVRYKTVVATQKIPRSEGVYENRLALVKWLNKNEYSTHIECFTDDDKEEKNNKPYLVHGDYYSSFDEALKGFLKRKEEKPEFKDLKIIHACEE